jgi:hypothetical protein
MKRLGVLLLLGACGGDADSRWNGSIETLPNGAVRVANPAQGIWAEDGGWRLVPERVLGTIDGAEPTVFASIAAVQAADNGRIYVLDRQANELRIFSADGEHVRTVGRSGGGPGEYVSANGLLWIASDTLVVIDQQGNRYSILTGDGEYVRSVPRSLGFFSWSFRGGQRPGKLYELAYVGQGKVMSRALIGTSLIDDAAADRSALVADAEGASTAHDVRMDTAHLPEFTEGPMYAAFRVENERGGMTMSVPFAPESIYYMDDRGDVWLGRGSEFRIVRTSFAGDTLMEILLDAQPLPVTDEEIQIWQEGSSVEQFLARGGDLDLDRIPRVKPFFDDMIVDDEGHLWVFTPSTAMQVNAAIFDPSGRFLGRLQAHGLRRDRYTAPVVRNGRLYITGRDDLDVPHLYVFRIETQDTPH